MILSLYTLTNGTPEHVVVYNGKQTDTHFVSHALEKYKSIITTRLPPNDTPEGVPYYVFRPKKLKLAVDVAYRMRTWGEHTVPFSMQKYELHEELNDSREYGHAITGADKQRKYAQRHFVPNFYQFIAIASHPSTPYFPHEKEKDIEGMYCSEAVTTAINVEYLLSMDAVKSCHELNVPWISDNTNQAMIEYWSKKLPKKFSPTKAYFKYCENNFAIRPYSDLRSSLSFNATKKPEIFPPSFVAWNYEKYGKIEDFATQCDSPMPLDPKLATPRAMFAFMKACPKHWVDMGQLTIATTLYPLEKLQSNKLAWKKYVKELFLVQERSKKH